MTAALSVAMLGLGVVASALLTARLARRPPAPSAPVFWLLGLAAPVPAWIVAFAGLMGPSAVGQPEPAQRIVFILSSAAGLLGAIVSDRLLAHRRATGRPPAPRASWLFGIAATAPAWLIVWVGLLVARR
jgi:hypothetical protein